MATLCTTRLQGGGDMYATGAIPFIKLIIKGTTIGTWNVHPLNACGKLHKLTYELCQYHWDMVGLAKVKWAGFSELTTDDSHKIWFSGDKMQHQHGVTFIIQKEVTGSVICGTPISTRLISIHISVKPNYITIIKAYVAMTDYEDIDVAEFYEKLENIIAKTPKKDIITVQGDWNAQAGPNTYEH